MPTLKFKDFPNIFKTITPLSIVRPKVTKAYFAEATIEEIEVESESGEQDNEIYTVESGDTLSKIANKKGTTVAAIIESDETITTANQNSLNIGQEITLPILVAGKEKKKKITFKKVDTGNLGQEIYVIVETELLQGKTMAINVRQGKKKGIEEQDENIMLKDDQDNYNTMVKTTIGGMCETDYLNKDDFADQAIFKITIDSSDKEKKDGWIKSLNDATDKKTLLYILADAHTLEGQTELNIQYLGDTEEGEIRGEKITNRWLDTDGQWFKFKLSSCGCDRDLTEQEVKDIIIAMRKSETYVYQGDNKEKLFFKDNCDLPEDDKTFKRFAEELNSVFDDYDINTCLRRMHFLAQVYHETDRFRTTKEYNETASYAPYIGRGLMQLTWESNYKKYKSYSDVDCVDDEELIANDLQNAFDSAGWFWKQGKVLSVGTTWSPPASAPSYVTVNSPSYSKTTITYEDEDGDTKSYGTIDMNLIADDDYVDVISWLVNGGGNGLTERQDYLEELKEVFEYDTKCKNKG